MTIGIESASRNNTSRLAIFFDTVVTYLSTPPNNAQPLAVARAIVYSGVPPRLAAYPITLGEQYAQRYSTVATGCLLVAPGY